MAKLCRGAMEKYCREFTSLFTVSFFYQIDELFGFGVHRNVRLKNTVAKRKLYRLGSFATEIFLESYGKQTDRVSMTIILEN